MPAVLRWLGHRPLWAVFLVALLVRLVPYVLMVSNPQRFFSNPDAFGYDTLAINLVQQRAFSLATTAPYTPDVSRTPIFPAFLAGIYLVFGHAPAVAVLVNIGVAALGCVFTYILGRQLFGTAVAYVASLALAFDVTAVVFANQLLTETLYTLLLVLSVLALWWYGQAGGSRRAALAGALLGVGTLCRPIGMFLFVLLAPVFIGCALRQAGGLRALWDYAIFALCAVLFAATWTARNYAVAGITDLTSVAAINAYYHRAGRILAVKQGIDSEEMHQRMREAFEQRMPEQYTTLAQRLETMKREAAEIVRANLGLYIRVHLQGITRMFWLEPDTLAGLFGDPAHQGHASPGWGKRVVGAAERGMHLLLYLLAVIGTWQVLGQGKYRVLALLLSLILYFFLLSGPEAYSRFQVPILPYMYLLGGVGAVSLWKTLRPAAVGCEHAHRY